MNGHHTIVQQAIHTQEELPELAHNYTDFIYMDRSSVTEAADEDWGGRVYDPKTRHATPI